MVSFQHIFDNLTSHIAHLSICDLPSKMNDDC